MDDLDAHVRLAAAVTDLFERMDSDTDEAWDHLTGLQVLLIREIAKRDRADRSTLAAVARTSRAAASPGLAAMIRKGLIREEDDAQGAHLVLSDEGRRLFDGVHAARAMWVRRAADSAEPPFTVADVDALAAALARLRSGL